MNKRMRLFTNKYSNSRSADEVKMIEVGIEEKLGGDSYILIKNDGTSFCAKKISKITFLYIKDTLFFLAFLFFHLYAFYYSLFVGIFFAVATASFLYFIDKISYKTIMRTITTIYLIAIIVVTAALIIYKASLNPHYISAALLLGVYLLGWIYIVKFYKVYDEIYILCNDAVADWWATPLYLFNKPRFFYWR